MAPAPPCSTPVKYPKKCGAHYIRPRPARPVSLYILLTARNKRTKTEHSTPVNLSKKPNTLSVKPNKTRTLKASPLLITSARKN